MFTQNNKSNIIPFSHFGYDHNEPADIFYRRNPVCNVLPNDLLQLVWENTSNGMRLTDSDGVIVAVNSAFCTLVHKPEAELVGKEFTVMYSPNEDADRLRDSYVKSLAAGNFQKNYEKPLRLNENSTLEIEITTTELLDEAQERYVLTEFRDISEQKRWERNVQESELNYRSLLEHSVLAMYQSTVEGKFINANNSMAKLLGYRSLSELRNIDSEAELYSDVKQREEIVEMMRRDGKIEGKEVQLKKKNGSVIHVVLYSRAITADAGAITGYEVTLEDMTFRKEAEAKILRYVTTIAEMHGELYALRAQKNKAAAVMFHGLCSPLNSIVGFCDLLNEEFSRLSDKEKIEFIGYIKRSAQQQLSLVNSTLDGSRIEIE
jgi:PAS domain S-box-containing protein